MTQPAIKNLKALESNLADQEEMIENLTRFLVQEHLLYLQNLEEATVLEIPRGPGWLEISKIPGLVLTLLENSR